MPKKSESTSDISPSVRAYSYAFGFLDRALWAFFTYQTYPWRKGLKQKTENLKSLCTLLRFLFSHPDCLDKVNSSTYMSWLDRVTVNYHYYFFDFLSEYDLDEIRKPSYPNAKEFVALVANFKGVVARDIPLADMSWFCFSGDVQINSALDIWVDHLYSDAFPEGSFGMSRNDTYKAFLDSIKRCPPIYDVTHAKYARLLLHYCSKRIKLPKEYVREGYKDATKLLDPAMLTEFAKKTRTLVAKKAVGDWNMRLNTYFPSRDEEDIIECLYGVSMNTVDPRAIDVFHFIESTWEIFVERLREKLEHMVDAEIGLPVQPVLHAPSRSPSVATPSETAPTPPLEDREELDRAESVTEEHDLCVDSQTCAPIAAECSSTPVKEAVKSDESPPATESIDLAHAQAKYTQSIRSNPSVTEPLAHTTTNDINAFEKAQIEILAPVKDDSPHAVDGIDEKDTAISPNNNEEDGGSPLENNSEERTPGKKKKKSAPVYVMPLKDIHNVVYKEEIPCRPGKEPYHPTLAAMGKIVRSAREENSSVSCYAIPPGSTTRCYYEPDVVYDILSNHPSHECKVIDKKIFQKLMKGKGQKLDNPKKHLWPNPKGKRARKPSRK